MELKADVSWKSFNKKGEELCGDKINVITTETSDIIILADGMGSGVKANILATLTTSILGTMFREGADIESCVETIAHTLPVCRERGSAYATFSILQIDRNAGAYLAEFDNPRCIFVREGRLWEYPVTPKIIEGKTIRESRFQLKNRDCLILMSDGVLYAGEGPLMNMGWQWEDMADYALKCERQRCSAPRLAAMLSQVCFDLYGGIPGDDTSVAVVRMVERRTVAILTGPPENKEEDEKVVADFMGTPGKKIVCGGTTAKIVSGITGREIIMEEFDETSHLPPPGKMRGVDLVTEGIITMNSALGYLRQFEKGDFNEDFFGMLDEDNGAARLAKMIIEDCTEVRLFVGKALNEANILPGMDFDISPRMSLVKQMKSCLLAMGKDVDIRYY